MTTRESILCSVPWGRGIPVSLLYTVKSSLCFLVEHFYFLSGGAFPCSGLQCPAYWTSRILIGPMDQRDEVHQGSVHPPRSCEYMDEVWRSWERHGQEVVVADFQDELVHETSLLHFGIMSLQIIFELFSSQPVTQYLAPMSLG